ncbi:NAD(P)H-binding protein [Endozoicomonas sp. SM1973]|uniref:NAD(P)H-binding protein n=1 Tax=Spartinivicinus marinus TaxID=2994442 RepID=A0A853I485_9GAMM|nr:NAD(P)H-binding protein [Spartinivicinus marinus]MCX4028889.1 NAD(P)H-binding protein [Spartinivicinus marinus]NYZ65528.1 NAD(P)H-binding protein [Spartinivicinus marinus]
MNILITGAAGFIGSAIVAELLAQGHQVYACVRNPRNLPKHPNLSIICLNLADCLTPKSWLPHLKPIDAVINCAGILTETKPGDFEQLHYHAPKALAETCLQQGIKCFIQLSALGNPTDGAFIRSKHQFDDYLIEQFPSAIIIRPSVVLSCRGSYGGTSLMRAIASLPMIPLAGDGNQQFQPILLEDLANIVCRLLTYQGDKRVFYPAGPEILSIKEFLGNLRQWLKWPEPHWLPTPLSLFKKLATLNSKLKIVPFNDTLLTMLEQGNVIPDNEYQALSQELNYSPQSVKSTLLNTPSFVQDRWHAKLYWIRPVLWFAITFIWLLSAVAGFIATPEQFAPTLNALAIPPAYQSTLVVLTSLLDLSLGMLFIMGWRPKLILSLMVLSVLGYTLMLGLFAPFTWLDPLGGLIKNVAVLMMLWCYWVIKEAR